MGAPKRRLLGLLASKKEDVGTTSNAESSSTWTSGLLKTPQPDVSSRGSTIAQSGTSNEPTSTAVRKYQPTGYECNWKDWLGVSFEKDTDLFMRWPAMFVRENIFRSGKKKRCEKNGMRLFKRFDRLNAYIQWQYCDKVDDTTEACTWRYNTNKKRNNRPRDV